MLFGGVVLLELVLLPFVATRAVFIIIAILDAVIVMAIHIVSTDSG